MQLEVLALFSNNLALMSHMSGIYLELWFSWFSWGGVQKMLKKRRKQTLTSLKS